MKGALGRSIWGERVRLSTLSAGREYLASDRAAQVSAGTAVKPVVAKATWEAAGAARCVLNS